MLEEKNDNLPQADGIENETTQELENVTAINQSALEEIDNSNAEESEDDSVKDRHDIPMLEYDTMSKEELTEELERLVANHKVMAIKDHVEEIKGAGAHIQLPELRMVCDPDEVAMLAAEQMVKRWETGDIGNPHVVCEVDDPFDVDLAVELQRLAFAVVNSDRSS